MNGRGEHFSLGSHWGVVIILSWRGGGTSPPIYTLLAKTDPTCVLPENYAILQRKTLYPIPSQLSNE